MRGVRCRLHDWDWVGRKTGKAAVDASALTNRSCKLVLPASLQTLWAFVLRPALPKTSNSPIKRAEWATKQTVPEVLQ